MDVFAMIECGLGNMQWNNNMLPVLSSIIKLPRTTLPVVCSVCLEESIHISLEIMPCAFRPTSPFYSLGAFI